MLRTAEPLSPPAFGSAFAAAEEDAAGGAAPPQVLIVDDDAGIRSLIGDFLIKHGFAAHAVADGAGMRRALAQQSFDLVILDLVIPGEDGLALLRELPREDGPAVIMLSGMASEVDRIVGLELGADDYVPKPCSPRELLARIRSVLRRRAQPAPGGAAPPPAGDDRTARYGFSGWVLDRAGRSLRNPDGQLVPLSGGEFTLLLSFVEEAGKVLSRETLLQLTRGERPQLDRSMDVQVSRLRRKLASGQLDEEFIRTVRAEGYLFLPEVRRV